jgi:hypothetical protein
MPKVSRDSAANRTDHGAAEDRSEQLNGYTVGFVSFRQDVDATPLLKGLPDDQCQCPHGGFAIKGRLTYRFGDREEVYAAGDAFYDPPGHVPISHEPGSEIVQFSPAEELRATEAATARNMQALQAG